MKEDIKNDIKKLDEIQRFLNNKKGDLKLRRLTLSAALSVASLILFAFSSISVKYQLLLLNFLSVILAILSFAFLPKIKILLNTKYSAIGFGPSMMVLAIWMIVKGGQYWDILGGEFKEFQPTLEGVAFSVTSLLLFVIYAAIFPKICQAFATYILEREWNQLWKKIWYSKLE